MEEARRRQPFAAFRSAYLAALGLAALTAALAPIAMTLSIVLMGADAPRPEHLEPEWVDWPTGATGLALSGFLLVVAYVFAVAMLLFAIGGLMAIAAPFFILGFLLMLGIADRFVPIARRPWAWPLLGVAAAWLPIAHPPKEMPWFALWLALVAAVSGWRGGRAYFADPLRSGRGIPPAPRGRPAS